MIKKNIKKINNILDNQNSNLLIIGTALIIGQNWRQWQKDKILAKHLEANRPPLPILSHTPKVSVLVAAWNERENIEAHIGSFLSLSYPNIELIICAGGCDGTLELAESLINTNVKILEQIKGEGKQRALRRSFEHATGEIIYLTDADCLFNDEALIRLLDVIINKHEMVATGQFNPFVVQQKHPFVCNQWAVDNYGRARSVEYVEGLIGRNTALTRESLVATAALNEDVPIGTDYYLARCLLAKGYRIRFIYYSSVATSYHESLKPYFRQQTRWLRNIVVHGNRFNANQQVRDVLKNCIFGFIFTSLPFIGILIKSRSVFIFWFLALINSSTNRFRYLNFAQACRQPPPCSAYFMAPLYALIDFLMLANAVVDIFLRKRNIW